MTEAQAIEAISELVVAQWPTVSGLPLSDLALENEALSSSDSFGQLTIQQTTSEQISQGPKGARRFKTSGNIFVKLWGPADKGAAGLATIADGLRSVLQSTSIAVGTGEPVTTLAAATRKLGKSNDGRWYMVVVVVPFYYFDQS